MARDPERSLRKKSTASKSKTRKKVPLIEQKASSRILRMRLILY